MLTNPWKPELYHGKGKQNFFEGWYFKLSDTKKNYVLAVIPGVSIGSDSHAFIQILDSNHFTNYYRFELLDFHFSNKPFKISIGNNHFSLNRLELNLEGIKADVAFGMLNPWPVSFFNPGAMGPYGFLPFLECYHGILSFNHTAAGAVVINGKKKDFQQGNGYIEKDWGTSFPKSWIWAASNNFEMSTASFSASIANVPFGTNYFVGFIIGLYVEGNLYQFTTYNGAKVYDLSINENKISFKALRKKYSLDVVITKNEGGILLAPESGNMTGRVNESLNSEIQIILQYKSKTIFVSKSNNTGLEITGPILQDIKNDEKGEVFLK